MKKNQGGFTLVEIAVVVLISGLMMAGAGLTLKDYLSSARTTTTQYRMSAIDNSLMQYQQNYGAYPCPAGIDNAPDISSYGVAKTSVSASAPNCANGTGTTFLLGMPGVIEGAVPMRTLNLPNEYIADGWGNRFFYAVTLNKTSKTNYAASNGAIVIKDAATIPNTITSNAQYIIVSTGADGLGSYSANGTAPTGSKACPTVGKTEKYNCNQGGWFVASQQTTGQNPDPTNVFDDLVTYHLYGANAVPSGSLFLFAGTSCPASTVSTNLPLSPPLSGYYVYCIKN